MTLAGTFPHEMTRFAHQAEFAQHPHQVLLSPVVLCADRFASREVGVRGLVDAHETEHDRVHGLDHARKRALWVSEEFQHAKQHGHVVFFGQGEGAVEVEQDVVGVHVAQVVARVGARGVQVLAQHLESAPEIRHVCALFDARSRQTTALMQPIFLGLGAEPPIDEARVPSAPPWPPRHGEKAGVQGINGPCRTCSEACNPHGVQL